MIASSDATTTILRPAEDVFALVDDFARAQEWLEGCLGLEQTSAGRRAEGSTVTFTYRKGSRYASADGVIAAYVPGERVALRISDGLFDYEIDTTVTAEAYGTRVRHACRLVPRSFMAKVLVRVAGPGLKRQVAESVHKLQRVALGKAPAER